MITVPDVDPHPLEAVTLEPEELFAAHFGSLCRTAFMVLGDAALAEEVVMDAFARVLGRWDAVQRANQPIAYVRRAVINLCVSRIRRLAAERRANARVGARPGSDDSRWEDALASAGVVLDAVRRLPPRQRACVVLRYFDDLAEAEIADALGCSIGTVKSQLAKARERLALVLSHEEG